MIQVCSNVFFEFMFRNTLLLQGLRKIWYNYILEVEQFASEIFISTPKK